MPVCKATVGVRECVVAWTPTWVGGALAGKVAVGPYPDPSTDGWSAKYLFIDGPFKWPRHYSPREVNARLLRLFHSLVVRDGLPPEAVHRAFLRIQEYREIIPADAPGLHETRGEEEE